jgi:DNA-binding NtrC family response regulator
VEKKILVVDDEEVIRNLLQEVFGNAGYIVRTAENAGKAMEILRQESIMVIYLDLKLPGMSGMELCGKLQIQNPLAIIHAITGYTDLYGLLECRKAGFDDFFQKPVAIKLLLESAQDAFKKLERWRVDEFDLV